MSTTLALPRPASIAQATVDETPATASCDVRCGVQCFAVGFVAAGLSITGLATETPMIVKLVALCGLVASLLVCEFAYTGLLGETAR